MSINRMLTAEPVKKSVNLRGGVRAVYDADGRPLCSVGKRRLYDLNGKPIAKYRKSETDSYEDVSLTERYYTDGKRLFLVSDGSLYLDGKWIGGVGPKRKSNILRWVVAAESALLVFVVVFAVFLRFIFDDSRLYPTLVIGDDNGSWGAQEELNIFAGKRLCPGTSGDYTFQVDNPEDRKLEYSIALDFSDDKGNPLLLPIVYTLKMNNAEIATSTEVGILAEELIFSANSSQVFTLTWEWPFDGNDAADTEIGFLGGKYVCTITVTAQAV